MEANAHQIVTLTKNWRYLHPDSKIALHSFITNGSKTNLKSSEMLHTCVKELWDMRGKKFENFALMLHELLSPVQEEKEEKEKEEYLSDSEDWLG